MADKLLERVSELELMVQGWEEEALATRQTIRTMRSRRNETARKARQAVALGMTHSEAEELWRCVHANGLSGVIPAWLYSRLNQFVPSA